MSSFTKYPIVPKSDCTEEHFGLQIPDPYRWLEDPQAEATQEFIKEQSLITETYISSCSNMNNIKEKLKSMWDFERFSCPIKYGIYYYYWRNSGLQNQRVLYQMESLTDEPKVFLDPNQLDPGGLISVHGCCFSEEGLYLCYGLSFGGSDWTELKFKNCLTGEDLPDVLKRVKFSSICWSHDETGVFYCMYRENAGKPVGTETINNVDQKLMYHRLGTPQSDDILCVERPDQPTWTIHADMSVCGRFLIVTLHKGCEPNNQLFYCDLAKIDYNVTAKLDIQPIVDRFEAVYEYVTNENSLHVFRTNLDAPMYKLIVINLEHPSKDNWRTLVAHDSHSLLEYAVCVDQDKLIVCHLKDVKHCLSVYHLQTGRKLTDIPLPLGSVMDISGRKRDKKVFVHFVSFLTPGKIYCYDFGQPQPELMV